MALIAVELNDAALWLAREAASGPQALGPAPGCAVLHEGKVILGEEAARRVRLAPLHAQNRYWHQLSLDRLPWGAGSVRTPADLAFAQLSELVAPWRTGADGLILAVPPGYTREQLGLLLGVANETGLPVRGLVDLGLAACAQQAPCAQFLHLDLQLHCAALTLIEYSRADGALHRSRYEILPGSGLLAIQQSLVETIATAFVRQTRFDPLHEAATEQRLVNRIPVWLAALEAAEEVDADIDAGAHTHNAKLSRAAILDAVDGRLADIHRLVQAARPAGVSVCMCVSAGAATVPGLLDRLRTLRDCSVVVLEGGAAALGAMSAADAIVRPEGAVALVHRLPAKGIVAAAAVATPVAVPAKERPSHVLHAGRAWPITRRPLVLGSAVTEGSGGPVLPAGTAGLSKRHCTLLATDGGALVEDHSTYGTFVNEERVVGAVALRVGDVLRLGTPGVTLSLIGVMRDDGTP